MHPNSKPITYSVEDRGYRSRCWINSQYTIQRDGIKYHVATLMWEAKNGPLPEGMILDHLCKQGYSRRMKRNSEVCIRPTHLEPVTWTENVQRGNNAKLTHSDIDTIRHLYPSRTCTRHEFAEAWGISEDQLKKIINGSRWRAPGVVRS